jgi:hypothetical protein
MWPILALYMLSLYNFSFSASEIGMYNIYKLFILIYPTGQSATGRGFTAVDGLKTSTPRTNNEYAAY